MDSWIRSSLRSPWPLSDAVREYERTKPFPVPRGATWPSDNRPQVELLPGLMALRSCLYSAIALVSGALGGCLPASPSRLPAACASSHPPPRPFPGLRVTEVVSRTGGKLEVLTAEKAPVQSLPPQSEVGLSLHLEM